MDARGRIFVEICARWDGVGIGVSDVSIDWPRFAMLAFLPLLLWGAVAAVVVAVLARVRPVIGGREGTSHPRWKFALREAAAGAAAQIPNSGLW